MFSKNFQSHCALEFKYINSTFSAKTFCRTKIQDILFALIKIKDHSHLDTSWNTALFTLKISLKLLRYYQIETLMITVNIRKLAALLKN